MITVRSGGATSLVDLSQQLNDVTERWSARGLRTNGVLDCGADLRATLRELGFTIAVGATLVTLLVSVALRDVRIGLSVGLFGRLAALGVLTLYGAAAITLDRASVAGIAIAVGFVVDAAFVLTVGGLTDMGDVTGQPDRASRAGRAGLPGLSVRTRLSRSRLRDRRDTLAGRATGRRFSL